MEHNWSTPTKIVVVIILLVLLVFFAQEIQPMLGPLVIAGLFAYILNLAVRYLDRRTRLSRKWIANIIYFSFVVLVIATPSTLVPVTVNQIQSLSAEIEDIRSQVEEVVANPIVVMGREIKLDQYWNELTTVTDFDFAFTGFRTVVEMTSLNLVRVIVIFVTSYYLLMDWHGLRDWIIDLLPADQQGDVMRLLSRIDLVWRAYMQGTLALMLIVGIIFTIIGLAIGLPGAVAIGFLTGFLSMIPEIGPWIAGFIAVAVAYIAGSHHIPITNFWFAVLVAAIYAVLTQVKAIWIRPQVMGRFMRMNTGLVFLAIIGAVMLQGILVALIILPILATVGIVGRYIHAKLLNLDPWADSAISTVEKAQAGSVDEASNSDDLVPD